MANADVYVGKSQAKQVGLLESRQGRHVFSYRHDAPEALSLTMPVRAESYQYDGLHPVFQMNLPEGALREALERMTAKQYGSDDLTLLTLLGQNQIGRISYARSGESLPTQQGDPLTLDSLLGNDDADLFRSLLQRYAMTSGVAGVQPKVLLDIQKRLTLPVEHYIVKGWGDEYPHLACNEYICMSIAKKAGLTVPEFHLSHNAQLFITKRFDLDERNQPFGFEDFCVLQGKTTKQKYDSSLEACANSLRQFVSPEHQVEALSDFYKLLYLNIRIRNGDAHLKNHGIIYKDLSGYRAGSIPKQSRVAAPVFDLVSTVPYLPQDSMALTLTGSKRWPKMKVLERFGMQHCGLKAEACEVLHGEVEQAILDIRPELEALAAKFSGFTPIAERMAGLFEV